MQEQNIMNINLVSLENVLFLRSLSKKPLSHSIGRVFHLIWEIWDNLESNKVK